MRFEYLSIPTLSLSLSLPASQQPNDRDPKHRSRIYRIYHIFLSRADARVSSRCFIRGVSLISLYQSIIHHCVGVAVGCVRVCV